MGTGAILEVTIADGTEEVSKQGRGKGAEGSPGDRGEHYDLTRQATSVEGGGRYYCPERKGRKKVAATIPGEGGQVPSLSENETYNVFTVAEQGEGTGG